MTSTAQVIVSTNSSGKTGMKSGATKFMAFPYSLVSSLRQRTLQLGRSDML